MAAAFWSGEATADWPPPDCLVQFPLTPTTSGMGLVLLPSVTGPAGKGPPGTARAGGASMAGARTDPAARVPRPSAAAVIPATNLLDIQIAFDLGQCFGMD
ncbi:hypothetical protein D9M72_614580 [compost metagenome]